MENWRSDLDMVHRVFSVRFAVLDTRVSGARSGTFFPSGRSPTSEWVVPEVRITRTTRITSDQYPESRPLRHNRTRAVVAEHSLDFTELGSEDLIRLGEDLLHAFSMFSQISWHSVDRGDHIYISSISDILVVSRGGEVPMSLSSEEAAVLAETFRTARPTY